jgi:hypothetical protein
LAAPSLGAANPSSNFPHIHTIEGDPSEAAAVTTWMFVAECPIPNDVADLMVPGEQPVAAYKTFRDSAIFTTKRLIVRDAQGMTGKQVEIYSLPYSAINMWSSENAGTFDLDAELQL